VICMEEDLRKLLLKPLDEFLKAFFVPSKIFTLY
jgi:hypothetical protein